MDGLMTDGFTGTRRIYSPDSMLWRRRLNWSSRTTRGLRSRMLRYKTTLAVSPAACPTPPSLPPKQRSKIGRSTCIQPFCIRHDPGMPPFMLQLPTSICTIPAFSSQHYLPALARSLYSSSMALSPKGGRSASFPIQRAHSTCSNSIDGVSDSTQAQEGCRLLSATRYQLLRSYYLAAFSAKRSTTVQFLPLTRKFLQATISTLVLVLTFLIFLMYCTHHQGIPRIRPTPPATHPW